MRTTKRQYKRKYPRAKAKVMNDMVFVGVIIVAALFSWFHL